MKCRLSLHVLAVVAAAVAIICLTQCFRVRAHKWFAANRSWIIEAGADCTCALCTAVTALSNTEIHGLMRLSCNMLDR